MLGFAIGWAVAVGGATAAYQSISPTGQWYGSSLFRLPRGTKQIALTFDDGPNDPHTGHLLDVLVKHDVHATFFMIGRYVCQRPDIAAEVARRGHTVGNHTFTHPFLAIQSGRRIREEITECTKALTDVVGEHSNLFRPPWGARRPAVFRIVRQLGLQPVMWNVTGFDWNSPPAEYIERKVSRRIRGGSVVLLHDGGHTALGADRSNTVKAVDTLIGRYKAEGYEFVSVPQEPSGH